MLGRRPDVIAARLQAEAQLHRIDQKKAEFYPNVNLSAFIGVQALGHGKVHLYRATLPVPANGVLQGVFDLRAVESALTRQFRPFQTGSTQALTQRILGLVPDLVGADPAIRA